MGYVISTTMSWLFPIDKDTENPNLVMTSLLNNLDAADNITKYRVTVLYYTTCPPVQLN